MAWDPFLTECLWPANIEERHDALGSMAGRLLALMARHMTRRMARHIVAGHTLAHTPLVRVLWGVVRIVFRDCTMGGRHVWCILYRLLTMDVSGLDGSRMDLAESDGLFNDTKTLVYWMSMPRTVA